MFRDLSTKVLNFDSKFKTSFYFNPLTPGAFCKKMRFLDIWFLGWISAKLALIRSNMRLQHMHNSWPFLPLALCFTTL